MQNAQVAAKDSILNFLSRVAQHRDHCPFEKLRQEKPQVVSKVSSFCAQSTSCE